jgi:hypothetical protein
MSEERFWDRPGIIWEAMVQLLGTVGLALFLAVCAYLVTL